MFFVRMLISTTKQLFVGFTSPNGFERDPTGYVTNQFGHFSLGVLGVWLMCVISFSVSDDIPHKEIMFIGIAALYIIKEIAFDGWRNFDTIEDFLFVVVYGGGWTLLAFTQQHNGSSEVTYDIMASSPIIVVISAHLTLGAVYRAW